MFELVETFRSRITCEAVELQIKGLRVSRLECGKGIKMKPVIGVDVSKGSSVGQAFLGKNKPFGKLCKFDHSKSGLEDFLLLLKEVERNAGVKPDVIMEATGNYHLPVIDLLHTHGYLVILLNPLTSQKSRAVHLRKVKTDASDAYHLGELYYREDFEPFHKRSEQLNNLRHLARNHEVMTSIYVQKKLIFQSILDQLFPLYVEVYRDLYSPTALRLIQEFTTPQMVIEAGVERIAEKIRLLNIRSKSPRWAREKAEKMMSVAQDSSPYSTVCEGHLITLNIMVEALLQHQQHLQCLETEMEQLAKSIREYDLLLSIPGIGGKLAVSILSEIGDIDQFDHAKKLVAFAGLDPSVYASGKFTATSNKITKRGSKRLRRALFLAVQCGLRRDANKRFREFYDKKRLEGKAHKVAIIACANKLLHILFALLKRGEPYRSDLIAE